MACGAVGGRRRLAPPAAPRSHDPAMNQPVVVAAETAIREEILRLTEARGA